MYLDQLGLNNAMVIYITLNLHSVESRCRMTGNWRSQRPSPAPYFIRRPQTFSIKINHLPKNVTEEELRRDFQHFGLLESIRISNGDISDYAFLNYHDEHSAQRAVSEMNGCVMRGRRLSVLALFAGSHHVQPLQFTVKVENLSKRTTEQMLKQSFRLGGQLSIHSSKVVDCYDEPVNYAYVNYTTKYEAEIAVAQLQHMIIDGSMIKVKLHSKERTCLPGVQSAAPMSYPPQGSSEITRTTHQAAPMCPPHTNRKSFSTLKVSIYGSEISPDDLEAIFAKYGRIIEKPIIKPGRPNFAYINFENPDHALAACEYFSSGRINIQGTHIAVKLHAGEGLQEPQNIIHESVQCDPLIANLIQAEAEKFIEDTGLVVTIRPKGTGGGLDIWGDLLSIDQVKPFAEFLVLNLEGAVGEERVSLHSLHIPAFANSKIVETLEELQQKHAFLLTIAGPPRNIPLREFHNIVAKELAVTGADNPQSSNSPQISTFLMFADTPDPAQYQWLWENDSGDYTLYPPDVCNQLSKHFATPPSSRHPCKIGPPMLPQSYTINVDTLIQTNDKSKRQRKIMKQEPPPTLSGSKFTVVISAFDTSGPKALLHEEFNKHTDTLKIDLPSTTNEALKSCLLDITKKYFVKAQFASTDSGEMMILEGVKEYINRIDLQLQHEILTHKSDIVAQAVTKASATFETPDDWEPQTVKSELKTVTEKSSEWKRIQSHVHKTLPSVQILKLERIQNQWLWEKYTFSKQRMIKKTKGDINEKELFHGTSGTLPEKVFKSEHGFDFRFSSQGMWGIGAYFAVNAQYSDGYAYSLGDSKQMILAKVLTGETCRCPSDRNLKKPPVKPSQSRSRPNGSSGEVFEDERYDSVSGYTNGSDIFVIYDHEKAYPAYLITYKTITTPRLY